jgi:hypothetical protein
MSRLWDTPDFWARSEADALLRDYPETDVRMLARSLERGRGSYESDPGFADDIIIELHKRAVAGVRFWPDPDDLAALENEVRTLLGSIDSGPEEAAPAYWWQRM